MGQLSDIKGVMRAFIKEYQADYLNESELDKLSMSDLVDILKEIGTKLTATDIVDMSPDTVAVFLLTVGDYEDEDIAEFNTKGLLDKVKKTIDIL